MNEYITVDCNGAYPSCGTCIVDMYEVYPDGHESWFTQNERDCVPHEGMCGNKIIDSGEDCDHPGKICNTVEVDGTTYVAYCTNQCKCPPIIIPDPL